MMNALPKGWHGDKDEAFEEGIHKLRDVVRHRDWHIMREFPGSVIEMVVEVEFLQARQEDLFSILCFSKRHCMHKRNPTLCIFSRCQPFL